MIQNDQLQVFDVTFIVEDWALDYPVDSIVVPWLSEASHVVIGDGRYLALAAILAQTFSELPSANAPSLVLFKYSLLSGQLQQYYNIDSF